MSVNASIRRFFSRFFVVYRVNNDTSRFRYLFNRLVPCKIGSLVLFLTKSSFTDGTPKFDRKMSHWISRKSVARERGDSADKINGKSKTNVFQKRFLISENRSTLEVNRARVCLFKCSRFSMIPEN